jgi:hypothetical protein
MLHSPEAVQKQLSDAVSIIGRYDFPNKWPDLISQMVEKFATGTYIFIFEGLHPVAIDGTPKDWYLHIIAVSFKCLQGFTFSHD